MYGDWKFETTIDHYSHMKQHELVIEPGDAAAGIKLKIRTRPTTDFNGGWDHYEIDAKDLVIMGGDSREMVTIIIVGAVLAYSLIGLGVGRLSVCIDNKTGAYFYGGGDVFSLGMVALFWPVSILIGCLGVISCGVGYLVQRIWRLGWY